MITKPDQFPKEPHYAALIFKSHSIQHPGDERSRTHPGHGYPAYTETVHAVEYQPFENKKAMEDWVLKVETQRDKPNYQLIEAKPLSATLSATVAING